jgi:hypothetical protein
VDQGLRDGLDPGSGGGLAEPVAHPLLDPGRHQQKQFTAVAHALQGTGDLSDVFVVAAAKAIEVGPGWMVTAWTVNPWSHATTAWAASWIAASRRASLMSDAVRVGRREMAR